MRDVPDDRRMLDLREDLRLPQEALGDAARRRLQQLERHALSVREIARDEHVRHAAAPRMRFDLEASRDGPLQETNLTQSPLRRDPSLPPHFFEQAFWPHA